MSERQIEIDRLTLKGNAFLRRACDLLDKERDVVARPALTLQERIRDLVARVLKTVPLLEDASGGERHITDEEREVLMAVLTPQLEALVNEQVAGAYEVAANCPLTIEPKHETERGMAAHLRDQIHALTPLDAQQAVERLINEALTKQRMVKMSAPFMIEDGFGSTWSKRCPTCGLLTMEVVRPGKVQCGNCG